MKREELLAKGYTEEQVTEILNMHHADLKAKNDEIAKLNSTITKNSDLESKYNDVQAKLDEINKANMSEQEKLQEREKAIAKKELETQKIYNTAKAKEILTQTGITGEDLDKLVSSVLGNDEATTINNATIFLNTLNAMKENTIKATKEELINMNAKPNGSNDPNNDNVMTFDKFKELSVEEQNKFAQEHPEEFNNL